MKVLKKIGKAIGITVLSLILLLIIGVTVWINYKSVLARHKIEGTEDYAKKVSEIQIADSVKVIGLGEATHGNAEFQELKLTMLQKLVENNGCRAIGLEMDAGDALALEKYIQGGEGSAEDALKKNNYILYRTKEMKELVDWMRTYNESAKETETLHLYGLDMQGVTLSATYLENYLKEQKLTGSEKELEDLKLLEDIEQYPYGREQELVAELDTIQGMLQKNAEKKKTEEVDLEYENMCYLIKTIQQNLNAPEFSDETYEQYNTYRDNCMCKNVQWMLQMMQKLGGKTVMISGHNGHLATVENEGAETLGMALQKVYDDQYFVIGTEFFKTNDNINTSAMFSETYERKNHRFCSADPLAYQAKRMEDQTYYLEFDSVPKESEALYEQIHSETMMGLIGEGYMPFWYLSDWYYRTEVVPAEAYDGVIYVYAATPITLLEEQ